MDPSLVISTYQLHWPGAGQPCSPGWPPAALIRLSALLATALNNHRVRALVAARLIATGGFAPRAARAGLAHRLPAFAAAVRVVARAHGGAAHGGPNAQVALAAGLAQLDIGMVEIADLANRRHADLGHEPHLAGGHAHLHVIALLAQQLGRGAGRARQLAALAGLQLDVVDQRAEWDVAHRQGVARADVDVLARDQGVANLDIQRRHNVALVAVDIEQQGNAGRAVRVILNRGHARRDVELVALEVDHAIMALGAAAAMPNADGAGIIAPAVAAQWAQQTALGRALGDFFERRAGHAAAARRSGFVNFDGHYLTPSNKSMVWSGRTVTMAFLYS